MAERGRPRSFDRQKALTSAMQVFWAKGYEGSSISDLTAEMGINSPSLYAAFGCKEALFREAVELYKATEGNVIWDVVPVASSARAAVEAMLRTSAEQFTRPGNPAGCFVTLSAVHSPRDQSAEPDEPGNPVFEELHHLRERPIDILRARFERAIADGELPEAADANAIASFYVTLQQGMSLRARDGAPREALLTIVGCAMRAWDEFASPRTAPAERELESE